MMTKENNNPNNFPTIQSSSLPSRFYIFGSTNDTREDWEKFPGKLAGSAQPGYHKGSMEGDAKLLEDLKNGLNPKIDNDLLDELEGVHKTGITSIFSVAHPEYDRNPELVKYIWEHKYPNTEYINKVGDVDLGIKDFYAPTQDQLNAIATNVLDRIKRGKNVLVHCGFGAGRTGTVLAAIQMAAQNEHDVDNSIKYIRKHYYHSAVEKEWQVEALKTYEREAVERIHTRINKSNSVKEKLFDYNGRVFSLETIERFMKNSFAQSSNNILGNIYGAVETFSNYVKNDVLSLLANNTLKEIDTEASTEYQNTSGSAQTLKFSPEIPSVAVSILGLQALYSLGKAGYEHIYRNSGPLADEEQVQRALKAMEAIYDQDKLNSIKNEYRGKHQDAENKISLAEMHLDILEHPEKLLKMEQKLAKARESDIYGLQKEHLNACEQEMRELKNLTLLNESEKSSKKHELKHLVKASKEMYTDYKNAFEIADKIETNIIDIKFSLEEGNVRVASLRDIEDKIYHTTKMADYLKNIDQVFESKSIVQEVNISLNQDYVQHVVTPNVLERKKPLRLL